MEDTGGCGPGRGQPDPARGGDGPVPRHEARWLTGGGDRATILHEGQAYTLRITRQNKLILTK